jgi:hypothetical protein
MKYIKKYESFSVNEELQLFNFAAALKKLASMSADEIKAKFPNIDKAVEKPEVSAVLSKQNIDSSDFSDPNANTQLSSVAVDLENQSESISLNEGNVFVDKLKSIWNKVKAPAALVSAAAALAPIFMGMKEFVTNVPSDTFKFLGFNDYDAGGQSFTGLGFAAMVYAVAALAFFIKKGLVDKQVAAETTAPKKPVNVVKRDKYGRPI